MAAAEVSAEATARESVIRQFGLLLGTVGRLERIAAREFENRCGISHAMFEVLIRLADDSDRRPRTMGDLAQDMILTSGGMTRLIDRMVGAGLVLRRPSDTDRRRQIVELTPAGEQKLAEAKLVHVETLSRHFTGPLTERQRDDLVVTLRLLDAHARRYLGDLG